jgi:hypothetical protein
MQLSIRALVERGVLTAEDVEAIDADREHFDESFAAPLREQWGKVRARSFVPLPGGETVEVDEDGLTIQDQLVLLTAGIEDLAREVRESRRESAGGVDPAGGAKPEPAKRSDPVPSDYQSLLDVAKNLQAHMASAGGTDGRDSSRSGGGQR